MNRVFSSNRACSVRSASGMVMIASTFSSRGPSPRPHLPLQEPLAQVARRALDRPAAIMQALAMGEDTATGGPARGFPSTSWSLILSAREGPEARRAALEALLE